MRFAIVRYRICTKKIVPRAFWGPYANISRNEGECIKCRENRTQFVIFGRNIVFPTIEIVISYLIITTERQNV